jgi:single-strand DNA-binding protein
MNYNKAIIVGRLTRDPESRTLPNSGNTVVNFSLATSRYYSKDGAKQEQTEFHNIVIFGRMAEVASKYLNKGSLVLIEGRIQTRSWEDKNNVKQYRTEIIAESMQLGPRSSNAPSTNPTESSSIPVIEEKEEEINVEDIPF